MRPCCAARRLPLISSSGGTCEVHITNNQRLALPTRRSPPGVVKRALHQLRHTPPGASNKTCLIPPPSGRRTTTQRLLPKGARSQPNALNIRKRKRARSATGLCVPRPQGGRASLQRGHPAFDQSNKSPLGPAEVVGSKPSDLLVPHLTSLVPVAPHLPPSPATRRHPLDHGHTPGGGPCIIRSPLAPASSPLSTLPPSPITPPPPNPALRVSVTAVDHAAVAPTSQHTYPLGAISADGHKHMEGTFHQPLPPPSPRYAHGTNPPRACHPTTRAGQHTPWSAHRPTIQSHHPSGLITHCVCAGSTNPLSAKKHPIYSDPSNRLVRFRVLAGRGPTGAERTQVTERDARGEATHELMAPPHQALMRLGARHTVPQRQCLWHACASKTRPGRVTQLV